jgi:hypothetical protein
LGKNSDGVSDVNASTLGPGGACAHDVRAHQNLFVGETILDWCEVRHRIRDQHKFRLAAVNGVAQPPSAHRLAATLGMVATQAEVTLAAGRDCPGDHGLPDFVARHSGTELLDNAHRFMADRQPACDRILALESMHVGTADRGRRYAQQCVARTDLWNRFVLQDDPTWLDENGGFHEQCLPMRLAPIARRTHQLLAFI